MRHFIMFFIPALLAACSQVSAQTVIPATAPAYLQPWPIELTTHKTSTIMFHYRITNIDTGSAAIMVRLANDTSIWLKAAADSFPETNLSVFTSDGRLHAFSVRYASEPRALYLLTGDTAGVAVTDALPLPLTADALHRYCLAAAANPNTHGRVSNGGVTVQLKGIYAADNLLFFSCVLANRTAVGFTVGHAGFSIRDKKHVKRTAQQVQLLTPVDTLGNLTQVAPESRDTVVFALPGFTVPKQKKLLLTITEQSGGRNLVLRIRNRAIINAGRL